jgi:hypothetical protein
MMAWLNRVPPGPTRTPSCEVYALAGTVPDSLLPPVGGVRLTSTVMRVRTTKSLTSPAGQFELTCTYEPPSGLYGALLGRPVSRILVPGNIVDIWLDAGLVGTPNMEWVMRGWVNSIEEQEALDGHGRPVRAITISGQDCGQFFVRHDLPGHLLTAYIQGDQEAAKRLQNGIALSGTTGKLLRQIFLAIFQDLTPLLAVVEEGQLLTEPVLDAEGPDDEDMWTSMLALDSIWDANGKFWSTFQQYLDRPWNECFGDLIPSPAFNEKFYGSYHLAKPNLPADATLLNAGGAGYYLIARRVPFSKARWSALPTTTIFDSEVKLARLRLADDERVNLVLVTPFGHGYDVTQDLWQQAAAYRGILLDRDSMRRYATQSMQARTLYTDLAAAHLDPDKIKEWVADDGSLSAVTHARTLALWRWFSINHELYRGVIVMAGTPSIRIGERVQNQPGGSDYFVATEQDRRAFYVEQVVQDYVDGSHYLTHLALTRGQPAGGFIEAKTDGIENVPEATSTVGPFAGGYVFPGGVPNG